VCCSSSLVLRTPVVLNASYIRIEGWASLSADMSVFFFWVLAVEVPCFVCVRACMCVCICVCVCVCVCVGAHMCTPLHWRGFWYHMLTIRLQSCRNLKYGRNPQEQGLDQDINKVVVKGLTALLTVLGSHVRCSELAPICLVVYFGQSSPLFHGL
jgi:hypothetical protein